MARRTQATHLAFGEGILVIPTNAGAVFGVDLLSNSLVWAYPYRERDVTPAVPAGGSAGPGIEPGSIGFTATATPRDSPASPAARCQRSCPWSASRANPGPAASSVEG